MLSTGIPELQNTEDIEYLRQALELDLTDAQVSEERGSFWERGRFETEREREKWWWSSIKR